MSTRRESVRFRSLGDELAAALFLPETDAPAPALILCHGAGDFKENYFEMSEQMAAHGIAALALDMHGHGASGGERFCVDMRQWSADVRAAIDYLQSRPEVNGDQIAAFGLSSGGTAILEAALQDERLKALIPLDATVRNSLPRPMNWLLKCLVLLGRIKLFLTNAPLRIPLQKIMPLPTLASDPAINSKILGCQRLWESYNAFPFPGGADAFFVDTLARVSRITAPTLVLWGEDDTVDPPETARRLYAALSCKKRLEIIPGNGHVGHHDRQKHQVFALTAEWILQNVTQAATERGLTNSEHGVQNHRSRSGKKTRAAREMGPAFAVS